MKAPQLSVLIRVYLIVLRKTNIWHDTKVLWLLTKKQNLDIISSSNDEKGFIKCPYELEL